MANLWTMANVKNYKEVLDNRSEDETFKWSRFAAFIQLDTSRPLQE